MVSIFIKYMETIKLPYDMAMKYTYEVAAGFKQNNVMCYLFKLIDCAHCSINVGLPNNSFLLILWAL